MPTAKKRSVKKAAVPAAGFTRKPAAKANTKPDSNVGTFTQRQTSAVASEAKQKELAQTDAVLLLKAKIELCHHQEDAESQKAATRQAEHDKAVQSYAKAKEQRKKEAEKADKELHNKKVEVLRKLLKHKAEFRAAGEYPLASTSRISAISCNPEFICDVNSIMHCCRKRCQHPSQEAETQ